MQRSLLITGAAGRIGRMLTSTFGERYTLRLTDTQPIATAAHPFMQADLSSIDTLAALCDGIDTVVHLAADPSTEAVWESLLPSNIVGVYHIYEAARRAGCRRVVFASSVNAVSGYPRETQVHPLMLPRAGNLYGATKAWGEVLGQHYADHHGLSVLCLRFGAVVPPDDDYWIVPDHPLLHIVLTYRDCAQLVRCAVDAPDTVRYGIFHGVSNNRYQKLDLAETRAILGYQPVDDSFALAETRRST